MARYAEYIKKNGRLYKRISEEEMKREIALEKYEWDLAQWKRAKRAEERAEWMAKWTELERRREAERAVEREAELKAEQERIAKQKARQAIVHEGKLVYVIENGRVRRKSTPAACILEEEVSQQYWKARQQAEEYWAGIEGTRILWRGQGRGLHSAEISPSFEYRVSTMVTGGNDRSYPYGKWVRGRRGSDAQWNDDMIWD